MLSAHSEFNRRVLEIEEFINHLEGIDAQIGFSAQLANTMKSSALLMLYNLVESTMTGLMQDVFDELNNNNISLAPLTKEMKIIVLGNAKRRNSIKLVKKMTELNVDFVFASFDPEDAFSGNIDCQKINETLIELGIRKRKKYNEPILFEIKKERNNLAHGSKSFADCGRSYTAIALREYHKKTVDILTKVIGDFESFLVGRAYS